MKILRSSPIVKLQYSEQPYLFYDYSLMQGVKIPIELFSRPWRIVPGRGGRGRRVNGEGRKGRRYPFEAWFEAELRGGGPFAMRVTPHPPPRYLPPSARRVASYIHMRAVGDAHAARRGQNLSAMHDRSVAYRLRRAARHYARGKQKDERLTAGQSPFAC